MPRLADAHWQARVGCRTAVETARRDLVAVPWGQVSWRTPPASRSSARGSSLHHRAGHRVLISLSVETGPRGPERSAAVLLHRDLLTRVQSCLSAPRGWRLGQGVGVGVGESIAHTQPACQPFAYTTGPPAGSIQDIRWNPNEGGRLTAGEGLGVSATCIFVFHVVIKGGQGRKGGWGWGWGVER